jgi:hypothetical protein
VYVVKLSVSITRGLVHSIVIDKLEPIVFSFEVTNSSPGFFRSISHISLIVKIQTSFVGQNLFLKLLKILKLSYLSHSKYKTTSTICSKVFGQAKFQSLFICQIIKTAVLVFFAKVVKTSLINLTCEILQETQEIFFECKTEMESTTKTSVLFFVKVSKISSIQVSDNNSKLFHLTHNLFALSAI